MTTMVGHSPLASLARSCRDPAWWMAAADVSAVLLAAALPWSTSLVAVFAVAMLLAMGPFADLKSLQRSLTRPVAWVPTALFLLAVVGTLWSSAPWSERIYAVGPTLKFLMLPFLFYHFERSARGHLVFIAFLVSCALLSVMSWIVAFHPSLSLKPPAYAARGIFVKDYIDQSQEFALCAVALAYPIVLLLRTRKIGLAILLLLVAVSFVANMAFVIVSRTALVTMPVLVAVFGMIHLRWRTNLLVAAALLAAAALSFFVSPQLQWKVETFSRDYELYRQGEPTSVGERLEYWRNALRFFAAAPLAGHGTGSTKGLFEEAARQPGWLAGVRVFPNPHNQTLNVAVQWGLLGIALLYAMWALHLMTFRGATIADWIGLLVVVQNIFTSLFNSHLFDFHEGWMYVLGVGVAGGMVLKGEPRRKCADGLNGSELVSAG